MGLSQGLLVGQWTDEEATAALTLDALVVGCKPLPDDWAAVPGGMVPDQPQGLLAVMGEAFGNPGPLIAGDLADGPPIDKAPQQSVQLRQKKARACQCLAIRLSLGRLVFHEAQGFVLCPGVHRRLGETAPPAFVLEAQRQSGLPYSQADQSVATIFFARRLGQDW
jgi:hypothetical protein